MRRKISRIIEVALALILIISAFPGQALAEAALELPTALQIIEEEAFYGATSIERVVVPDGTTEIRARAFAQSTLREIELPATLTFIAEDAFSGCEDIAVSVPEGCYAYEWCMEHGLIASKTYSANVRCDRQEGLAGQSATWTAEAVNGRAPYRYLFELYRDGAKIATRAYSETAEYTHTFTAAGVYHVVVKVKDDDGEVVTAQSAALSVALDALRIANVECDSAQIQTGDAVTWTVDASGGQAPYAYAFTLLKDGNIVAEQAASASDAFCFTFDQEGDYILRVQLTDALNDAAEPFECAVGVTLSPLRIASLEADSPNWQTDEPLTLTAEAEGGEEPYLFSFEVFANGVSLGKSTPREQTVYAFVPDDASVYAVEATVSDANGTTAQRMLEDIEITLKPLTIEKVSAGTAWVKLGTPIQWSVTAVGGVKPLRYAFDVFVDGAEMDGRAFSEDAGFVYTPDAPGLYEVNVRVRDAQGNTIELYGGETHVYEAIAIHSVTADVEQCQTGEQIIWTVASAGGMDEIVYAYEVYCDGVLVETATSLEAQFVYTPMQAGAYTLQVTATDAGGESAQADGEMVLVTKRTSVTPAEEFTYEAINGLYARITGYTGMDASVVVPETIGDYTVQEIGTGAFRDNAALQSIALPDTVTIIAASAFRNCDALLGVDLGQGVITVDDYAFYDCDALRSFTFPDSVTTTGNQVLRNCDALAEVHFSANWTSTGTYTVANCPQLTEIELPEGLTTVPQSAFCYCTNLLEVRLPSTLLTIKEYAFGGCTGLKGMDFNDGLQTIESNAFRDCLGLTQLQLPSSLKNLSGFYGCENLTAIAIPDGLQSVGRFAFAGCTALQSALLPDSVTTIGMGAFEDCRSLRAFHYPLNWQTTDINEYDDTANGILKGCQLITEIEVPEGVSYIPSYAFTNCDYVLRVILPSTLTEIGYAAFQNCDALQRFVVPDSVSSIGQYAFAECSNLVSVELSDALISIGAYAFSKCGKLIDPSFPLELEEIGRNAYEYCASIQMALLPDSVRSIGSEAFYRCSQLHTIHYPINLETAGHEDINGIFEGCDQLIYVEIPEGVEVIPSSIFSQTSSLQQVVFPSTLRRINQAAFNRCSGLTEITLPAGLEYIEYNAFSGCSNLKKVVLPDSIKQIEGCAFYKCTALVEVNFPKSWSICNDLAGDGPFAGCTSLTRFIVPEGVTSIPKYAFAGMEYLEDIQLPDTLVEIQEGAFYNCKFLKELNVPNGLSEIGKNAFMNCEALRTLDFPDSLEVIGIGAFRGCINLETVLLPDSVHTIGEYAFNNCESLFSFRYPKNWTRVISDSAYEQSYRGIFGGCISLTSISVPEGVVEIPPSAFAYAPSLSEVQLPSTLEDIGTIAFRQCPALTKIVLPESLKRIGSWAFMNTNLKIYCEYGSVALQYAIDNSIPYFYLSLTDASTPGGTLYKGDSFVLYGYVRSSDAISNVTGTIYDASGTALQTVALAPDVTDYNLNGAYNASLKFGSLALGNYTYELVATAGEETETLARSAFTIAPPPLRIYVSGLNIPEGLLDTGDGFSIGGTVVSNYAISSLSISLYTADGVQRYENTVYPGTLTYALADLAGEIPIASLPVGEYRIRIQATAKGETRLLSDKTFQPVDLDESIDEETLAAVIAFVSDPENATLFPSDYVNTSLGKMDFDTILIMAVNGRMDWLYGLASTIFAENHENQYLVELYENELSAIISDLNPDTIVLENIGETEKMFANAFLEFDITAFEAYKQGMLDRFNFKDGEIQKAYMDYLDSDFKEVISALDDVKTGLKGVAMSVELANNLANGMCNYLNGIEIMAMVVESVDGGNNPEFRTAAMRLYSKYKSESLNILLSAMETFASECLEWSVDEIISAMASLASQTNSYINGATLYNIVNFAIDASMAITGYDDIAKDYQTFMIQVETYSTGRTLYEEAFVDVRSGDTSARTVNQLLLSFTYARQASLRIHETICDLTSTSSAEEQAIREYIRMLEETAIVD